MYYVWSRCGYLIEMVVRGGRGIAQRVLGGLHQRGRQILQVIRVALRILGKKDD